MMLQVSSLKSYIRLVGLCAVLAIAATVCRADDLTYRFSSVGPDKYQDGTDVLPGECYALVWTRDGAAFAGFAADGTAANPADSAVLIVAPVATKGPNGMHCPNVLFQLDSTLAANYVGGTLRVCLLDTRLAGGKMLAGLTEAGEPKVINAFGEVAGSAKRPSGGLIAGASRANTILGTSDVTAIPAGTPRPRIKDFRLVGKQAFLTVADTVPYLQYNVRAAKTPGGVAKGAKSAKEPKNGAVGQDIILVVPADGDSGCYGIDRN